MNSVIRYHDNRIDEGAVEPADPDVGDPVGAARTFTAACDQAATMRVYLDGTRVHTSGSGVQQVSYTVPSAPAGEHMVREAYWLSPRTSPVAPNYPRPACRATPRAAAATSSGSPR